MSEEVWEIRIDYGEDEKPSQYKAKDENGISYLYGYFKGYKSNWRLIAIRFDKIKFKSVEAVEQYLNEKVKQRVIGQISAGIWNSRIQNEVLVLLNLADVKLKNTRVNNNWWEA